MLSWTSASAPLMRAQFDTVLNDSPESSNAEVRIEACNGTTTLTAPGLSISTASREVHHHVEARTVTLCVGSPRIGRCEDHNPARAFAKAMSQRGSVDGAWLRGRYLIAHFDLACRKLTAATDRFAVYPLCFAERETQIFLSDRADAVPFPESPGLDEQAIYDYVYFHVIPASRTIFREVHRLPPSRALTFDAQGLRLSSTWRPEFRPDDSTSLNDLKHEFRELVSEAVAREATTANIGAFLSGGTDSSTVVGMLGNVIQRPPPTFSIGFEEAGYDEMNYARIAARHFGADQHEYYVKPDDLAHSIPIVARHYDQPFGNSSAVAAYLCARLARDHGIEKMLAGDGGDELFGGNTRYAKQKTFNAYNVAPAALRKHVLEPLLLRQPSVNRLPFLRKIASYIEQARIPMPDRMETYNLLDRFGASKIFTSHFLQRIDRGAPLELQRKVYAEADAASMIDRMLAYDWRFTLADNDLPKVVGSTQIAGEMVGFPLLDDDLLDFSLRLSPELKVRGLTLRYFFKEALRGFLPEETIRKRKHGFGLPFGPWLTRSPELLFLARSSLEHLADRGVIRRELVSDLFSNKIAQHAGYYGELIWVLMMLEQWLQVKATNFTAG